MMNRCIIYAVVGLLVSACASGPTLVARCPADDVRPWNELIQTDDVAALECRYPDGLPATESDDVVPLVLAVSSESAAATQWLLSQGAPVNDADATGTRPIHAAASNGSVVLLELLTDAGADLNPANNDGATPLMMAVWYGHDEVAAALLKGGADVSPRLHTGQGALHLASRRGHAVMVDLLLAHGAAVDAADHDGVTPLMLASQQQDALPIVQRMLVAGADPLSANRLGWTSIHQAAVNCSTQILPALLDASRSTGTTDPISPLALASGAGCSGAVRLLVERGAAVDAEGPGGVTALMIAAQNGHEDLVSWLLEAGADPDRRDAKGRDYCAWSSIGTDSRP